MLFSIQYNEQGMPYMQASMSPFAVTWNKTEEDETDGNKASNAHA